MSFSITVEVTMEVRDEKQAEAIFEAASNGLAEIAIKDRVLYGGFSKEGTTPQASAAKREEASKELVPVATKVSGTRATLVPEPKQERVKGVLGRRQLNRKGGG